MKNINVSILLFLLTCTASAFEIGLSQRGIEFGECGKRHFKMLYICEAALSSDGEFESKISMLTQWLNLRKERLNINFSSSIGVGLGLGCTQLDISILNCESEIMIGKNSSFYMRGRLFGIFFGDLSYDPARYKYTYTGIIPPDIEGYRYVSNIAIGIRLKLKNRQ